MKKIVVITLVLITCQLKGQNPYDNVLNGHLNDIIKKQLLNELEYELPVNSLLQSLAKIGTYITVHNRMYFKDEKDMLNYIHEPENIIANDLNQYLNLQLINTLEFEGALLIKCFSDKRMLLTTNYESKEQEESLQYSVPGRNLSKELKFENGRIVSDKTAKLYDYETNYEYSEDGTIHVLNYESKDGKYKISEEEYENGRLSIIHNYKKSVNKELRKPLYKKLYSYTNTGALEKVITVNKRGRPIDSSKYFTTVRL